MASQADWTGFETTDQAMGQLQEILEGVVAAYEVMEDCLSKAEERLMRARSWGGAFAAIDFSPEVKAMLARNAMRRKALVS